jgi:hypothetical protein
LNPPNQQAKVSRETPEPKNEPNAPPPNSPQPAANNTNSIIPKRKKEYVFVAFGNKVNLVHPTFEEIWDSGASSHMFKNYAFFKNVGKNNAKHEAIMTAGSEELKVEASGDVKLKGVTIEKFTLKDSLYIPTLQNNLIAAGALKQKGAIEVPNPSNPNKFIIAFDDKAFLRGQYINNLMVVKIEPVSKVDLNLKKKEYAENSDFNIDHN